MCFPVDGADPDLLIGEAPAGPVPQRSGAADNESVLIGDSPEERDEIDIDRSNREERERKRRQMRDLGSIFDKIDRGSTSPFAVFGPRLGVNSISDVRPGEQGRGVTIADLKVGL